MLRSSYLYFLVQCSFSCVSEVQVLVNNPQQSWSQEEQSHWTYWEKLKIGKWNSGRHRSKEAMKHLPHSPEEPALLQDWASSESHWESPLWFSNCAEEPRSLDFEQAPKWNRQGSSHSMRCRNLTDFTLKESHLPGEQISPKDSINNNGCLLGN